ncbi:hypothetical protein [Desulfopila sp. IMCC35008]|nr:hypothetical protein [Desulfopila sp. IMCC35008]
MNIKQWYLETGVQMKKRTENQPFSLRTPSFPPAKLKVLCTLWMKLHR